MARQRRTRDAALRAFEWMLACRYLRPRRKETFISVIAVFSFLGIMLGVATLIIVMAVMNGFRAELLDKILGINGHVVVQPIDGDLTDYDEVTTRIRAVPGVTAALPIVEGQVLASGPAAASSGVLVRGVRGADLLDHGEGRRHDPARRHAGRTSTQSGGVAIGTRLAAGLGLAVGDKITLLSPRRRGHADGHVAAGQSLSGRRDLRDRHVGIRFDLRLHAARGGAGLLQLARCGAGDRGLPRRPGSMSAPCGRRSRRRRAGRSSRSTGGSATSPSSPRSRSSGT